MFQERLKLARNNANISQKELAKRLFISQQAYAKYETGASSPNPETKLDSVATRDQNEIVSKNDFNAKQISDFLNKIIKSFE